MRWKNRKLILTVNIPEECKDDEEFANDLAEILDSNDWKITVMRDGRKIPLQVRKALIGDIEIKQE